MIAIPWLWVALLLTTPSPPAPLVVAHPAFRYDQFVLARKPGPWGELQYSRILIEPPEEFTARDYVGQEKLRWYFKGYSDATLMALWQNAGLNAQELSSLAGPGVVDHRPDAIVISPPPNLVEELTESARATIYSALSVFPENLNQCEPFRFRADDTSDWFDHADLPAATLALVKKMLYRRGTSLLFSDQDIVLTHLRSAQQRVKLIKVLARKSTLLVKLVVKPDSDLDALATYWDRGPRRKAIRPILESVSHRPGGIAIDIVHLIPRFARAHLYTYPEASDHPGDENHDCHWSSLNFFNDPADEKFADADVVRSTLENEYYNLGSGSPLLGDVLVLKRADGAVIHSCVYIADDIVFTKNGSSASMPWIFMTLADVTAFYPADPPVTVEVFRRKDL